MGLLNQDPTTTIQTVIPASAIVVIYQVTTSIRTVISNTVYAESSTVHTYIYCSMYSTVPIHPCSKAVIFFRPV